MSFEVTFCAPGVLALSGSDILRFSALHGHESHNLERIAWDVENRRIRDSREVRRFTEFLRLDADSAFFSVSAKNRRISNFHKIQNTTNTSTTTRTSSTVTTGVGETAAPHDSAVKSSARVLSIRDEKKPPEGGMNRASPGGGNQAVCLARCSRRVATSGGRFFISTSYASRSLMQ